tara:strand:- start:827 stop:2017 length:1191 start_codon:yes stop_codon:yes gene_type:complete
MDKFQGDLRDFWRFDILPPVHRLSWWWWWVLVLIPDPKNPSRSKQLMVLWSSKDTSAIRVSGHWWTPGASRRIDDHGGHTMSGMVCAWWYDGEKMHEPLLMKECKMVSLDDKHPLWPEEKEGLGEGGGAVVPITSEDLSFGLRSNRESFWLNLSSDSKMVKAGAPSKFSLEMTPWWEKSSTSAYTNNVFAMDMGYDIIRIHGTKAVLEIDDKKFEGSAYIQKVGVQAPSPPWFWGMLHFDDGSYLDWFMPHVSPSFTMKDDTPWSIRDFFRKPVTGAGIFHDHKRNRTEHFKRCTVELAQQEGTDLLRDEQGNILPLFRIKVWNGRTQISLHVRATSRARWIFDQPTRAGFVSHLTYNEYPLEVLKIAILDEEGLRTSDDYEWMRGNAEHSWGILN